MRALATVLKLLAPVPVAIGAGHALFALRMDALLGANVDAAALADPVLDSQNRFYGVIFAGLGPLIWLSASDPRRYRWVLRAVGGAIAVGGVARLLSIALRGLPSPAVLALTAIELVAVPALLLWHEVELRKGES